MNAPAAIHRRAPQDEADMVIARGPLLIMAHGLMALKPAERGACWIRCEGSDLTPRDAEDALRIWQSGNC